MVREIGAECRVIFNDPVVHHRNAMPGVRLVAMRVGIPITRLAMGGPAGMSNAQPTVESIIVLDLLLKHPDSPGRLRLMEPPIEDGHAGGVVPTVFQPLQTLQKKGSSGLFTDICNDSTHGSR